MDVKAKARYSPEYLALSDGAARPEPGRAGPPRQAGVVVKSLFDVFAGKRWMSTRMREGIADCFGVPAHGF
jgi:hypothetical protein